MLFLHLIKASIGFEIQFSRPISDAFNKARYFKGSQLFLCAANHNEWLLTMMGRGRFSVLKRQLIASNQEDTHTFLKFEPLDLPFGCASTIYDGQEATAVIISFFGAVTKC